MKGTPCDLNLCSCSFCYVSKADFPASDDDHDDDDDDNDTWSLSSSTSSLEISPVFIDLQMDLLAHDKERISPTWICLYIKTLTQQRCTFFSKSFTDVCKLQCVQGGAMTDLSGACIHLVWRVQGHSGLPGMASRQESVLQRPQTLQLPAERIQSAAVWLRERQIGRAPPPATGVSWDICYSCKLVCIRYVIQGLKLKPKWMHDFWNSLQTSQCFLLMQPAVVFSGAKGISSKRKSLKRVLQRSLRETYSASRKGRFKMPRSWHGWKNTLGCQGRGGHLKWYMKIQ